MPSQHAVNREISVKVRQQFLGTRGVTPIPHQVARNGKEGNELNARLLHAGVCRVADELSVGAGTFDIGEDGVAFCAEGKCQERGADVSCDTRDNDLLLAGGFDCGLEFWVVPGATWVVRIGWEICRGKR